MTLRADQPPEVITFVGHQGRCRYCADSIVKMMRDPETLRLLPDACWCLACGQPYFVDLAGQSIEDWEEQQWREKAEHQ